MSSIPKQYQETIQQFVTEYFARRRWEIEQAFLGVQIPHLRPEAIYQSALADQLTEIARAANGEMSDDEWTRGVVYEGIQDLMERLFAPPGLTGAYDIPERFWDTPLGQMVGRAFIWVKGDELITLTAAAEIRGVSVQAISQAVRKGRLRHYIDPDAANPQKSRTLVSRADVEADLDIGE